MREHHQFGVGGVSAEFGERFDQVVDLFVGKGETPCAVFGAEFLGAAVQYIDASEGARCVVRKEFFGVVDLTEHLFCHPVVDELFGRGVDRIASALEGVEDRKSTRLNSSHVASSYAV